MMNTNEHRRLSGRMGEHRENRAARVSSEQRQEDAISLMVFEALSGGRGPELMEHLRDQTMRVAYGGDVQPNQLMHVEGRRWMVAYISQHFERGKVLRSTTMTEEPSHG